MGSEWKKEFPGASKEDIRKFLHLFVDAFAFKRAYKLRFEPSDRIMDIYDATTGKWGVDSLELETLSADIARNYRVDLSSIWHKRLTLGELFRYAASAQQSAAPDSGDATRLPRG
jgi:hypothetical protein